MNKKAWLLAGALCCMVAAPVSAQTRPGVPPGLPGKPAAGKKHPDARPTFAVCKERKCYLAVKVDDCKVSVDPEYIAVAHRNTAAELIWEIADKGYTFADKEPIFFKDPKRAEGVFVRPQLSRDKSSYVLTDSNEKPGVFHYGVKVMKGKTACPVIDPTVINDMP